MSEGGFRTTESLWATFSHWGNHETFSNVCKLILFRVLAFSLLHITTTSTYVQVYA